MPAAGEPEVVVVKLVFFLDGRVRGGMETATTDPKVGLSGLFYGIIALVSRETGPTYYYSGTILVP